MRQSEIAKHKTKEKCRLLCIYKSTAPTYYMKFVILRLSCIQIKMLHIVTTKKLNKNISMKNDYIIFLNVAFLFVSFSFFFLFVRFLHHHRCSLIFLFQSKVMNEHKNREREIIKTISKSKIIQVKKRSKFNCTVIACDVQYLKYSYKYIRYYAPIQSIRFTCRITAWIIQ